MCWTCASHAHTRKAMCTDLLGQGVTRQRPRRTPLLGMPMKRRSARIEQQQVRRIVDAVRRGDVEWIAKSARRELWWGPDADAAVTDAYLECHTPGMLDALRSADFTKVRGVREDGRRARLSHACLGVPIPDHILEEDCIGSDYSCETSVCALGALECALRTRDYDAALRIWKNYSPRVDLPSDAALRECAAGRCEEFQARFLKPALAVHGRLVSIRPVLCLHGVASYERACTVVAQRGSPSSKAAIVSCFFEMITFGAEKCIAWAEEQAAFLFCAIEDGMDVEDLPDQRKIREGLRPETQSICQRRFRIPIVDAVAIRIPVEGVPEIVASYVCCPFDVLF